MEPAQIFLERSRYYLSTEYLSKLRHCVAGMPDEVLWKRANESSNSIANLVIHLDGNVREWIIGGVGGLAFDRDRSAEFACRDGLPAERLVTHLTQTLAEADGVLARLTGEDLSRPRTIQNRETTVLAAIYHVIEHFAMHTGQIVLLAKQHVRGAIHFYDDSDGAARPLWGGAEGSR